jgi:hypothetical protein
LGVLGGNFACLRYTTSSAGKNRLHDVTKSAP